MADYSAVTLAMDQLPTRPFYFRAQTTDERVIQTVFEQRNYSFNRLRRVGELVIFNRRLQAQGLKSLIVDAGANIGASAVFYASSIPGAHVVAVEPDAGNFDLLVMNTAGLAVEPVRAAIASRAGRARVEDGGIGHWGYRTNMLGSDVIEREEIRSEQSEADTVSCLTIDEIYASHAPSCHPFLVKIDIEGAEAELFSANTDWIARTPLIVIELHDWMLPKASTAAPFLRCISQQPRDFVHLGEDIYSIAHDLEALSMAGADQ